MTDEKLADYPTSDDRSFGYEVARTAIDAATSIVPGGGYAVGKLVERFVSAPLQKRRDEWFERVGEGLRDLQERLGGFDPSKLEENDDFLSAVYEATQAAMKTAKDEKLEALRNGILNIASGMRLEDILRSAFFGYIDRFSPAHLRVLHLISNPSASPEMREAAKDTYAGAQINTLRAALPESEIDEPALKRILADFQREGLAHTDGMRAMSTQGSLLSKRTTDAGDAFLRFVSKP